jgi:uncharacterized protein (UPF0335 family)
LLGRSRLTIAGISVLEGSTMAKHSNGYDSKQLEGYLSEIARVDDQLASLKGDYMQRCRAPREQIKEILDSAKEAGINMVAFRQVLAKHRDTRKQDRRIADLEADDASAYELMLQALGEFGDTPLGKAALDRAKDDTLDSLR